MFIVTYVARLTKQPAQTSCRQHLVSSRVCYLRKRRTFVSLVQFRPLPPILQPVKSRQGN